MKHWKILWAALALTFCLLVPAAKANCWSYWLYPPINCHWQTCNDTYTTSICAGGCTPGTCVDAANSGLCCNHYEYHNAQIYPDGDFTCPNCEQPPIRHPASQPSADRSIAAGTREAFSETWARLVFVPNKCARTFRVAVEEKNINSAGGS
jgi:hypothetical protein